MLQVWTYNHEEWVISIKLLKRIQECYFGRVFLLDWFLLGFLWYFFMKKVDIAASLHAIEWCGRSDRSIPEHRSQYRFNSFGTQRKEQIGWLLNYWSPIVFPIRRSQTKSYHLIIKIREPIFWRRKKCNCYGLKLNIFLKNTIEPWIYLFHLYLFIFLYHRQYTLWCSVQGAQAQSFLIGAQNMFFLETTADEQILALEANGDYTEALPLYQLSTENKEVCFIQNDMSCVL